MQNVVWYEAAYVNNMGKRGDVLLYASFKAEPEQRMIEAQKRCPDGHRLFWIAPQQGIPA